MLPLLVRMRHAETGVQRDAGFRRSPVRVGRSALNDLPLDEAFVSQWHAIIRFDDEGTRFLDLGSTNGTVLHGAPLEKNVEVDLDDKTELVIGPDRLIVNVITVFAPAFACVTLLIETLAAFISSFVIVAVFVAPPLIAPGIGCGDVVKWSCGFDSATLNVSSDSLAVSP